MDIADELRKLKELHETGGLSDEEFARAKATILSGAPPPPPFPYLSPEAKEHATRQWAMFIHLSLYAGYLVPLAGLIVPIILWQIKKDELPGVDVHGKVVVNWIISKILFLVVCLALCIVCIGFPLVAALLICGLIFPLIGGLKANNGEVWRYPMSIRWLQ